MIGGILCGFFSGILGGMGIGGGVVLIPALVLFMNMPQQTAQGINLLYFIPTAAGALYFHIKNGLVNKKLVISYGICGILGAVLGAIIAASVSPKVLKTLFSVFLLLIGVFEVFKKKK